MALAKTAPPTLSAFIVAGLQVASITGIITLSQPHIMLLGPALDIIIQMLLAFSIPVAQFVKARWDRARVASPETGVELAEATLEAARSGAVTVKPEAVEAAHRVMESKMAELVKR